MLRRRQCFIVRVCDAYFASSEFTQQDDFQEVFERELAGFAQFAAFAQDAKGNKVFEQKKLPMPVLAVGGQTWANPGG